MGCVTATAKRRRRQAVGRWMNLRPMDRPNYGSHTVATYEKRASAAAEKRRNMATRAARKRAS